MATQTTYDTVGVKEDVSDVITDIDPTETPFISSIKDKKITQPFFQWQTDSLAAPATNAQVEGADATFLTVTPSVMLNGYTQILEKAIVISGSTQASEYHGRKDEVAYQIVKRGEEIKRDLEYACIGSNQAGAAGADGTARQLTIRVWLAFAPALPTPQTRTLKGRPSQEPIAPEELLEEN